MLHSSTAKPLMVLLAYSCYACPMFCLPAHFHMPLLLCQHCPLRRVHTHGLNVHCFCCVHNSSDACATQRSSVLRHLCSCPSKGASCLSILRLLLVVLLQPAHAKTLLLPSKLWFLLGDTLYFPTSLALIVVHPILHLLPVLFNTPTLLQAPS